MVKIRQGLVQVFEGIKPRYSIALSKLASPSSQKSMAKSLDLDEETVEKVCAEILEQHQPEEPERKQRNVKVVKNKLAQENVEPVVLQHLSMIENPAVADKPVVVEAVVGSTSISYLVPRTLEVAVIDKDGNDEQLPLEIGERNPINIKLVGINEDIKYRRLKRHVVESVDKPGSRIRIEEKDWRTIYKVRVRPPVFTLEKWEGKIVDEKGFEYKSYDVYVAADKPITFAASSLIKLTGVVLPNPQSQNTTLLAYQVEFPEECSSFNVEKLELLRKRFNAFSIQERINWILSNFAKFSQIVGRENLAFGGFLIFFTPIEIKLNGQVERGWGNGAYVGDTTTGKSETNKKLISLLNAGMLITAETASAVGLVGAALQSEKGQWSVDWGFLVLNDRRLLAVDGAHKLPFSQWAALAESERSGFVTIAKAAKNSAYARTRQIKIANAVDREADKFSTKSMKEFLYPAQALSTVFDKTGIARLDLAVFADSRDVKAEEVNKQLDSNYDKNLGLLAETLRWCWSDKAKIEFTLAAVNEILCSATKIHERFFSEAVPICSIDMKWKLARLTAALAFLTLSTNDYKTVTVTEEHVKAVVAFIEEEYSKAGLNALAQESMFEALDLEDVSAIVNRIVVETNNAVDPETLIEIIKFIVLQGRVTRDQLKTTFGLAEKNQLRPLIAALSNEKLIRTGKGFYPTSKLIEVYKLLCSAKVATVAKHEKEPPTRRDLESFLERANDPPEGSLSEVGKLGNLGKNTTKQESGANE